MVDFSWGFSGSAGWTILLCTYRRNKVIIHLYKQAWLTVYGSVVGARKEGGLYKWINRDKWWVLPCVACSYRERGVLVCLSDRRIWIMYYHGLLAGSMGEALNLFHSPWACFEDNVDKDRGTFYTALCPTSGKHFTLVQGRIINQSSSLCTWSTFVMDVNRANFVGCLNSPFQPKQKILKSIQRIIVKQITLFYSKKRNCC